MLDRSKATEENPLLNQLAPGAYEPEAGRTEDDDVNKVYDTSSAFYLKRTHISQQRYDQIFQNAMQYLTTTEIMLYKKAQLGEVSKNDFVKQMTNYLKRSFPDELNNPSRVSDCENDISALIDRLLVAVYGYYVLQPLIDNPYTSDIKVSGVKDIRVRVRGKALQSNANFIGEKDLNQFVNGIALRNQITFNEKNASPTFVDDNHPDYKLRFVLSHPYLNAIDTPYIHIRKIPKKKLTAEQLIEAGMMDENINRYLKDRAKSSKLIAFSGPPGSGKTNLLNLAIEYIPCTRETLVIQENDELYTEKPGYMFKHVTHGEGGNPEYDLIYLGQKALVEGCNEFVIGEAKGAEMRPAMTLLTGGGHGMLTTHSESARGTAERLADLIKYGSTYSYEEAKRMLGRVLDTVFYLEGFKVREILECTGYNEEKHDFEYVCVYKYRG